MNQRTTTQKISIVNYWHGCTQNSDPRNYAECSNFRQSVDHFEKALSFPFFFIDHLRVDLVHASTGVGSYLPSLGMDVYGDDYELSSKNIVPEHYHFATQLSHRLIFDRLYALPAEQRASFVFSKDYLIKTDKGEKIWILQKGRVLDVDTKGLILLSMYELHNINCQRKEAHCNIILSSKNMPSELYQFDSDAGELSKKMKLSEQHAQVLSLLAKNMHSKEIADALNISKNTADTHRRHLLERFGCVDTTALVEYSKLTEIL